VIGGGEVKIVCVEFGLKTQTKIEIWSFLFAREFSNSPRTSIQFNSIIQFYNCALTLPIPIPIPSFLRFILLPALDERKERLNREGMGASLSNLGTTGSAAAPGLGDIPESCVARVFLHLTPPEICNLARLNRSFRGAASADSVWRTKLPRNYQDLLDLMPPERYRNLSKKDIFALLSRPVPFDDGNKVLRGVLLCLWVAWLIIGD